MKNEIRIIGASLAAMAGILLVSGGAWAQATEKPIQFRLRGCADSAEPERKWVDDDGIEHARDVRYSCRRVGSVIGEEIGWYSEDRDPVGGHLFVRAYYSFTGTILTEPVTGVGRGTEECDRIEGVWKCTGLDVMQLHGGGLVKSSAAWEENEAAIYSGFLLDPPGGEKRNGPRSK